MMKRGRFGLRSEFVAALLLVIAASGILSYVGNVLLARQAIDEMVAQTDLEVARSMATSLAAYYKQTGSWSGIEAEVARLRVESLLPQDHVDTTKPRGGKQETPLIVTDAQGTSVFNGFNQMEHGTASPTNFDTSKALPIQNEGTTVGYLFFKSMAFQVYNPKEQRFIESINTTLVASLGIQIVIALLLGLLLSTRFVRPITRLETAVKRIALGSLHEHVRVLGPREIATLSSHFNSMVDQLQAQESARQNLLADVAHELRTPVSILQANLEMMIEGVYPTDRERLSSLYEETQLLTKLIGELRTISDLETGVGREPLESVDLLKVVEECCRKHEPLFLAEGVALRLVPPRGNPEVMVEPHRLAQVLGNFLDNARKHAVGSTEVHVEVSEVETGAQAASVRVAFLDQGPGVPDEDLHRLFDRFYRSDRSRNRERGGRGLGLAICRQFVTSWGGTLGAENRAPHGLNIWFELPIVAPLKKS